MNWLSKFLKSAFDPQKNGPELMSMSESKGKSGSFFFVTHDKHFVIKTISDEEVEKLIEKAEEFSEYITENEETLIGRIYGVYTIMVDISKVNVIVMQNLMQFPQDCIQRVFDLKGSKANRFTSNLETIPLTQALKDLDFLWMINADPYV